MATACGGGAASAQKPDPQFATHWTQLAATYQSSVQQLQASGRNAIAAGGHSDTLAIAGGLRDLTERTLTQLRATRPPASLDQTYGRAVKNLEDQKSALDDALSADAKNDQPGVQKALTRFLSALGDWMQAAQQLTAAVSKGGH
jgi:hypothetical protein